MFLIHWSKLSCPFHLFSAEPQMPVSLLRNGSSPWRAVDQTIHQKVWLVYIFQCARIFSQRRCQRIQSYRATGKLLDNGIQDRPVIVIQTKTVHI